MFDDVPIHRSKPPLRWIANLAGDISSKAIGRISWAEEEGRDKGFRYRKNVFLFGLLWPLYRSYGTFYTFDMSGKEWDDYDENGVPYWEKTGVVDPDYDPIDYEQWHWDYIDEETGDAFKVINYGEKKEEK